MSGQPAGAPAARPTAVQSSGARSASRAAWKTGLGWPGRIEPAEAHPGVGRDAGRHRMVVEAPEDEAGEPGRAAGHLDRLRRPLRPAGRRPRRRTTSRTPTRSPGTPAKRASAGTSSRSMRLSGSRTASGARRSGYGWMPKRSIGTPSACSFAPPTPPDRGRRRGSGRGCPRRPGRRGSRRARPRRRRAPSARTPRSCWARRTCACWARSSRRTGAPADSAGRRRRRSRRDPAGSAARRWARARRWPTRARARTRAAPRGRRASSARRRHRAPSSRRRGRPGRAAARGAASRSPTSRRRCARPRGRSRARRAARRERALGGVVADRERHAGRVRGRRVAQAGGPASPGPAPRSASSESRMWARASMQQGAASRPEVGGCRSVTRAGHRTIAASRCATKAGGSRPAPRGCGAGRASPATGSR